jgi:ribosomal protein S6--L-glutamate ligase
LQKNKELEQVCIARVIDRRMVSDSSGKKEKRFVIESDLCISNTKIKIEITLVNRDSMTFRMLLGRDAVKQFDMLVDPSKSFLQGRIKKSKALKLYHKIKDLKE